MSSSPVTLPVITVDGPSGVGKGMVTRWLQQTLRWHRLDSGALYRILALAAVDAGLPLDAPEPIAKLARDLDVGFIGADEASEAILVGGRDRTREVRSETTGGLASQIAVHSQVRDALFDRQRAFLQSPGLIADGRDMGTVVFPEAEIKLFLDASPRERARRRLNQLSAMGKSAILEDLFNDVVARDRRDRERAVAPLKAASDAIVIDTTGLDPVAVLALIEPRIREKGWLPGQQA